MSIQKTEEYGDVWCLWTTRHDGQFEESEGLDIQIILLMQGQTVCLIYRDGAKKIIRDTSDGESGFVDFVPGPLRLPVLQEKPK